MLILSKIGRREKSKNHRKANSLSRTLLKIQLPFLAAASYRMPRRISAKVKEQRRMQMKNINKSQL